MIAREIFDHASSPEIGKQNAIYVKLFGHFGFVVGFFNEFTKISILFTAF